MLPFRVAAAVAGASGIVAALLGVVGLYGVIAYLVVRRTGEMAIRSALGARAGALVRHVLATGGWVIAAGLGSGAVLALVVHRVASTGRGGRPGRRCGGLDLGVLLLLMAVCAAAFVAPALRIVRLDEPRAPWRIHAGLPSDGDAKPGLPILLRMPNVFAAAGFRYRLNATGT